MTFVRLYSMIWDEGSPPIGLAIWMDLQATLSNESIRLLSSNSRSLLNLIVIGSR